MIALVGLSFLIASRLAAVVDTDHLFEWVAGGCMAVLVGLCLALLKKTSEAERIAVVFMTEVRTALLGIDRSGGMIDKVDALMQYMAGEEGRLRDVRHGMRNEVAARLLELETDLAKRMQSLEDRLDRLTPERRDRSR